MDDKKDRMKWEVFETGCLSSIVLIGLVIFFTLLILTGCSPRIIETVKTEVVYRDRIERDTTFVHDSTYIREYIKGDTVRITEYRDHLVYRYKYIRDTLAVHDTTAIETIKEVQVEKELTAIQKAKMNSFWWLLLAVVGLLLWTFRKPLIKLITGLG